MSPSAERVLGSCVSHEGVVDWHGVHLLQTVIPLSVFLDIEELATVRRDHKLAWDSFLAANPGWLKKAGG